MFVPARLWNPHSFFFLHDSFDMTLLVAYAQRPSVIIIQLLDIIALK